MVSSDIGKEEREGLEEGKSIKTEDRLGLEEKIGKGMRSRDLGRLEEKGKVDS